jgi:xanthine/uracil permease
MTNHVEKRWHDPAAFRAAVTYAVSVIAVAGIALVVFAFTRETVAAVLVPAVLFLGGIGAFIQTYRVWRRGGTWPIWQGAGWFLFAVFLLGLPVAGAVL